MRLLIFILLLTALKSFSQTIHAEAIKQDWATGKCCSHGTNYTITINSDSLQPNAIKIKSICIDEKLFKQGDYKVFNSKKNERIKLSLSWAEDNEEEGSDMFSKSTKNKRPLCKGKNKVVIMVGNNYYTIAIKIVKAIPSPPYP